MDVFGELTNPSKRPSVAAWLATIDDSDCRLASSAFRNDIAPIQQQFSTLLPPCFHGCLIGGSKGRRVAEIR
jgi:hypothetical protein